MSNSTGNYRHGFSKTRLYNVWKCMKERCYNPNNEKYPRYGARGITVCDEWLHDPKSFCEWALSHGYRQELTIDRINNDKGYSPDNCRWTDMSTQSINRKQHKSNTGHIGIAKRVERRKNGVYVRLRPLKKPLLQGMIFLKTWKARWRNGELHST